MNTVNVKKDLKIILNKWEIFDLDEKINIWDYNAVINKIQLFDIIKQYKIPFSFQFQIYSVFESKYKKEKKIKKLLKMQKF